MGKGIPTVAVLHVPCGNDTYPSGLCHRVLFSDVGCCRLMTISCNYALNHRFRELFGVFCSL